MENSLFQSCSILSKHFPIEGCRKGQRHKPNYHQLNTNVENVIPAKCFVGTKKPCDSQQMVRFGDLGRPDLFVGSSFPIVLKHALFGDILHQIGKAFIVVSFLHRQWFCHRSFSSARNPFSFADQCVFSLNFPGENAYCSIAKLVRLPTLSLYVSRGVFDRFVRIFFHHDAFNYSHVVVNDFLEESFLVL